VGTKFPLRRNSSIFWAALCPISFSTNISWLTSFGWTTIRNSNKKHPEPWWRYTLTSHIVGIVQKHFDEQNRRFNIQQGNIRHCCLLLGPRYLYYYLAFCVVVFFVLSVVGGVNVFCGSCGNCWPRFMRW